MKFIRSILLLLTITWPTVFAIYCYQCNSNDNSDCISLPYYIHRNETILEPTLCPSNSNGNGSEPFCRKIRYYVSDNNADWHERIIRNCGYVKSKQPCHSYNNNDHEERVCQCFEDGCNSAHSTTATSALAALSCLTAFLFR